MTRHQVLIIYDVHHDGPDGRLLWAYGVRARALQRHAPPDLDITIACHNEADQILRRNRFHLCFILDYQCAAAWRRKIDQYRIPVVASFNKDARSRHAEWPKVIAAAHFTIVNNEHRFRHAGVQPRTCCISNGVELDVFRPIEPIGKRPHRCLWTGGTGRAKQKNYHECVELLKRPLHDRGMSHSFRPITAIEPGQVLTTEQMVEWYNSGSYILNASNTEGTPCTFLEGMACGCVPITTDVGNVPEIGIHDSNCLIVDSPDPVKFLEAIDYAREHRERLSAAALESIQSWGYGGENGRAQWFYQLWRRIILDGADSIKPFSYATTHWRNI